MPALSTIKQVPGYFNYVKSENLTYRERFELTKVDDIEEAVFSAIIKDEKVNDNRCLSCNRNLKSDLPMTSELGEINSPYELIYARLESLQFYSRA